MNKTWKIFGILLLAANLFVLNSCGLLEAPEQEWEEYDFTYENAGGSVELSCYVMYSSEDTSYTGKSSSTTITLPAGLSVLLVPKDLTLSNSALDDILGSNFDATKNYILKTFPVNSEIQIQTSDTDENSTKSITMNKTKWIALYHAIAWTEKDATDPKTYFKDRTEFESANLSSNFTWKKLLKSILYSLL